MHSYDLAVINGKTRAPFELSRETTMPSGTRVLHYGDLEVRISQKTWKKLRLITVRSRNQGKDSVFCELRLFSPTPLSRNALYWDGYRERRWEGKRMRATNATPADASPVRLSDHLYPEIYTSLNPSERRFTTAMRKEFSNECQVFVFPAAAAWTPAALTAVGVDPRQELAYHSSGIDKQGRLFSAVKRVVLPGENLETVFVGFDTQNHQGSRTVLQTYYDHFPSVYHPRKELPASLTGAAATVKAYDLTEVASVLEEDFRRFDVRWTWDIGEATNGMMVYEKEEDLDALRSKRSEPLRSASLRKITARMRKTNETLRQFCVPCYGLTFEHASSKLIERHGFQDAAWVRSDGTPHIRHFHEKCELLFANQSSYHRYLEKQIRKSLKQLRHSGFIFDNAGGTRMYFGPLAETTPSRAFVNGKIYSTSGISHVGLMRTMQTLKDEDGAVCPVAANTPADFNLARHTDIAILEGGPWINYRDWPRLLRQMMGRKLVMFWGPKGFPGWLEETEESLPRKIDEVVQDLSLYGIALGILPNAAHSVRGFPVMHALLPVLRQIAREGWRPEGDFVQEKGQSTVEQFGRHLITVTNFSGIRDRTILRIPGNWGLAIPLLDGTVKSEESKNALRVSLDLPPKSAQVLHLARGERAALEWKRQGSQLRVHGRKKDTKVRIDLSILENVAAGLVSDEPRPRRHIQVGARPCPVTLVGRIWDRLDNADWLHAWQNESGPPLISLVGVKKDREKIAERIRLYLAYWQASLEEEASSAKERLAFEGGDHDTKFLMRIGERVREKLKLKNGPTWTIRFKHESLRPLPSTIHWVLESGSPGELCLRGKNASFLDDLLSALDRHFPLHGIRAMEERRYLKARSHLLHVET